MSPSAESPSAFEAAVPGSLALSRPASVAVIGAGLAGLACATRLVSYGFRVQVFDKGRRPGGRTSTRRVGSGEGATVDATDGPAVGAPATWQFDHGAQYFTVRDPVFAERVGEWLSEGTAAVWHGRIRVLERNRLGPEREGSEGPTVRYVGVPGMGSLGRRLAGECRVVSEARVDALERQGRRWVPMDGEGEELGRYDLAVVAVPAPQAVPLLRDAPELAARAEAVRMAPTWALLLGYTTSLELPFDGAFVQGSPLSWMARNGSKPGRSGSEGWVLHASHPWSREHLDEAEEKIAERLFEIFVTAARRSSGTVPPEPEVALAHRWRFAAPETPLTSRYLLDPELGVGACGDWCGGPRLEGAYLSGWALAGALVESWGDLAGPAA